MDTALIEILIQAGSSGVLIFMLYDMRREAKEQREQTWALLIYMVQRQYPDVDMSLIVPGPKRSGA